MHTDKWREELIIYIDTYLPTGQTFCSSRALVERYAEELCESQSRNRSNVCAICSKGKEAKEKNTLTRPSDQASRWKTIRVCCDKFLWCIVCRARFPWPFVCSNDRKCSTASICLRLCLLLCFFISMLLLMVPFLCQVEQQGVGHPAACHIRCGEDKSKRLASSEREAMIKWFMRYSIESHR